MNAQKVDKFSLDEALRAGWSNCWKYFWPYTGVLTSTCLLCYGPQMVTSTIAYFNQSGTAIYAAILVGIITSVLQDLVAMGCLNLQLRVLDGKTIQTRDVFSVFPLFVRYLCAGFVYHLIVFAGYVCLIVPGIIWQIKFQYYGYLIIERGLGPMQALKASAKLTEGAKMDLFLFGIVQWFINGLGIMCFIVGQFPAYLVNTIASAHIYRQLLAKSSESELLAAPALPGAAQPAASAASGITVEAIEQPEEKKDSPEKLPEKLQLSDPAKLPEAT